MNYRKIYDDIESEFYYIKVDDKIVGTTQSVYNDKIYGAYLQTELGSYPNELYKKFGFEDLCVVYYYLKN